ncbi:unnamed protein product [Diamesa hyperborea]
MRKWSPIKILMSLWLAIYSLLVFWCQGALSMHLTPLNLSSFHLQHPNLSAQHQQQQQQLQQQTTLNSETVGSSEGLQFLLRNSTLNQEQQQQQLKHEPYNYYTQQQQQLQQPAIPALSSSNRDDLKLQKLWQNRMREKRARIQAHRRQRQLLERLVEQQQKQLLHNDDSSSGRISSNNKQIIYNPNRNINLKNLLINHKMANNINNRNRRDSRFHHQSSIQQPKDHHHQHHSQQQQQQQQHHNNQQQQQPLQQQLQQHQSSSNQNNRIRQRRYCSARDAKTLAFEAPTVFEGKVKSMSSDRRANFSVTFEIVKIYKQQAGFKLPQNVRLQFTYKNYSECDIYREEFRQRGFVRDELEQGKLYFLFVKQINLGNFTILGQPIKKNRRTANDVSEGVSANYGKRASIDSLTSNITVREGKRVRIVCKVSGQPAPKVTWFKDGRSINRNRLKYVFVHLRRRSDLIIKSAVPSDQGRFECRAKNKLSAKPVSNFTRIEVLPKHTPIAKPPNGWPNPGIPCPTEGGKSYCLNGGTCLYIEQFKEPSCNCPEGFSGMICENKTPNITSSTYTKQQECNNHYIGGFYC